jgi:hypothetical protein
VWLVIGVVSLIVVALIVASLSSEQGATTPAAPAVVEVVAPPSLCWSGAFGDRTVEGCGNQTVALKDMAGVYSANAQKQDDGASELTLVLTVGGRELDRTSTRRGLSLNPPRIGALCGVLAGQELFGGRWALHPEGERREWQNDASYQAKRTTPAITSVDSGLAAATMSDLKVSSPAAGRQPSGVRCSPPG